MDASKIARDALKGLRKAKARSRGPVTIYLDKALYKAFQGKCEKTWGVSVSRGIEKLIEAALKPRP